MRTLKKLEINKLIKELEFVKSDLDYKSELLSEADFLFYESVNQFLEKHPELKDVFQEKIRRRKEIIIENQMKLEVSEEIEEDKREPKLKSLYRNIAKSTHPDKLHDDNLKEVYIEAKTAYENNDILEIFAICEKLNIPFEVSEEEVSLIREEIQKNKTRSSFLESTFTWQWFRQEDERTKEMIILDYIKRQMIS